MHGEFKKNWPVWLAIALPMVMIVFVAASVYLPRMWAPKPQYNFLYQSDERYGAAYEYSYTVYVRNGRLTRQGTNCGQDRDVQGKVGQVVCVEPRLYLYDVQTGESRAIELEEAQKLKLDDRTQSPDGFEVKTGGGYSGPFGGSSEMAAYLSGHMMSQKLNLGGLNEVYAFQFLGWTVQ